MIHLMFIIPLPIILLSLFLSFAERTRAENDVNTGVASYNAGLGPDYYIFWVFSELETPFCLLFRDISGQKRTNLFI